MTDNEKAATFAGWKQVHKCEESYGPNVWDQGWKEKGFHCHYCGVPSPTSPAPDMSKPENYMRALEAVVESKSYWNVILDLTDKECSLEADPMPLKKPVRDIRCDGETIAEAVIKTLAALYDAEHKDQ